MLALAFMQLSKPTSNISPQTVQFTFKQDLANPIQLHYLRTTSKPGYSPAYLPPIENMPK